MERKLAAFVSTDIVGYSRLIGANEPETPAPMKAHRRALWIPVIDKHGGSRPPGIPAIIRLDWE